MTGLVPNAVPFFVELGGRFSESTRRFVDEVLVDRAQPGDLLVAHKLFRQICWNLLDHNAYCMSELTQELAIPDLAAAPAASAVCTLEFEFHLLLSVLRLLLCAIAPSWCFFSVVHEHTAAL